MLVLSRYKTMKLWIVILKNSFVCNLAFSLRLPSSKHTIMSLDCFNFSSSKCLNNFWIFLTVNVGIELVFALLSLKRNFWQNEIYIFSYFSNHGWNFGSLSQDSLKKKKFLTYSLSFYSNFIISSKNINKCTKYKSQDKALFLTSIT